MCNNITRTQAIEIINKVRISNPFTMGQTIDEYVKFFRKRYKNIIEEDIDYDYISIAKAIIKYGLE